MHAADVFGGIRMLLGELFEDEVSVGPSETVEYLPYSIDRSAGSEPRGEADKEFDAVGGPVRYDFGAESGISDIRAPGRFGSAFDEYGMVGNGFHTELVGK